VTREDPAVSDQPQRSVTPSADPGITPAVADPATTTGTGPPLDRGDCAPPPAPPGYELIEEIGRGGMGVVYRARDLDLDRGVAVKLLQGRFPADGPAARRFVEEARITSQLQHPGIPPVHDLGTLPDGRPFLAMKLIKGRTLDAILASRVSAATGSDPHPPVHTVGSPNLIAIFEQVCQAVGYAHAHRVIHRDLKPANVMVSAFGEVQVMDWGLAKILTAGPAGRTGVSAGRETIAATEIRIDRDPESATEAGALLGTPAFMPPEQAGGEGEKVDERADVFGLGAVLCVILTREPPYIGPTTAAVRLMAVRGQLSDAFGRLDGCGADPGLVDLCRRCLSPDRDARPQNAGEVAKGVAALRAEAEERARRAELDRARAAEQRKRQRLQFALFVLALVVGGGFVWWRNLEAAVEQGRQDRNAWAVAALLDRCKEALEANDAAKATLALEAAEKRAAEGGAEKLADRLEGLRADLAVLKELDAVDQFRWTVVENTLPNPAAEAAKFRAALGRFGADPDAVSPDAAAARVSGSAVRNRLVAALDLILEVEKSDRVRAVLRMVDPHPYRDAVRDAVRAGDGPKVAALARQPDAADQPAGFVAVLGASEMVPAEQRRALLRAAVGRGYGELGLLMALGGTYPHDRLEGADERARWYQAAVAVAPANPAAHNNLGAALRDGKHLDEAEAALRKAIHLDPTHAHAHNNLGNVLHDRKDLDGAEAEYRKTLDLDSRYVPAHNNLGNVLHDRKDLDGAEAEYREAIRLDPRLAPAHNNLGNVLRDRKDLDGAEAEYREAIRLDPAYATAHNNLGSVLDDRRDLAGAEAEYREAIRVDPRYAPAHVNLALLLYRRKDLAGAEVAFREAIRLDPTDALAHYSLGNVLSGRKDLAGAEAAYREAIRLDPDYPEAHCNLGGLLRQQGRLAEALPLFRRGHELGTQRPGWPYPSAKWVADCERLLTAQEARTAPPPREVKRP
jgi:serine/threonine protein kinase/Flp pilus assembly protein TadD